MKSAFLPRLINGPFGDPGLHVSLRWQGVALQFDLGSLDRFPAASVLRLRYIFVSHMHLDHFIGFDRVLRLFLPRDATLRIYGPPGLTANVCGKLAGYTWNLVDGYPFAVVAHDVGEDRIERTRLRACTGFRAEPEGCVPFSGTLVEEPAFRVDTTHLDHRIPCLAFALSEPTHLNVRGDRLAEMGLAPGPWLNTLKAAVRTGQSGDTRIAARLAQPGQPPIEMRLEDLQRELLVSTPGQKLVYVVDTLFSRSNVDKIVALAREADVLFCESLFLDADRHEALKRSHLTARQAGSLARWAMVKQLRTFHFSPRYGGVADPLYAEAQATFRGEIEPDEPF